MAESRFKRFSGIVTDSFPEEKATAKSDKKPSKFLRPGLYNDVPIIDVIDNGPSASDKDWIKFTIKFQIGTTEVWHFVQVPTKSLLFGEKQTDMPFRNLQRLSKAFGIDLNKDNVNIVLGALFDQPEKMIGLRADLVLAHESYYASPEHGKVLIRNKDDKPILGDDQVNPLAFPDFEAARIYCDMNSLAYSISPKIKWLNNPKTPNDSNLIDRLLTPSESKKKSSCPF